MISACGITDRAGCSGFDEQQQIRQAVPGVRIRMQSIHLREKNIAYPTERSQNAKHFASS